MIEEKDIKKTQKIVEELLQKMTIGDFTVKTRLNEVENDKNGPVEKKEVIEVDIEAQDPQMLIGQNGQTLSELQYILKIILNKKLSLEHQEAAPKYFYLTLDINGYKKKKVEYISDLAITLANEAVLTKTKKILPPMSSYERRIVHAELSKREDVATTSQGEGIERHIVIEPR